MPETNAESPMVILSDGVVSLRHWSRADAAFMAQASADPAIQRYNGDLDREGRPAWPLSPEQAEAVIDTFTASWSAFATTGMPDGVVYAIVDAKTGELAGCCGVDSWVEDRRGSVRVLARTGRQGTGLRDPRGHPPYALVVRPRRGTRLPHHRRRE